MNRALAKQIAIQNQASIRTTGGAITPLQLRTIASLSSQHGADAVHITTRQEFQIHDVALERVVPILRGLLTVGLSTRGGGGNTVRNIMVSPEACLGDDEVFDPSPYAFALTTMLIAEADSWNLPRKLKISFSNSAADSAFAQFNDIGFIASVRDGVQGFKVYVAGGLGRKPAVGHVLHEFIEASEIYSISGAIKRVFDRHGNRKNRNSARLRFLWNELGEEKFVELYRAEFHSLAKLSSSRLNPTVFEDEERKSPLQPSTQSGHEYDLWKRRFCQQHSTSGTYTVLVPATLGNIQNIDLIALTSLLDHVNANSIRATSVRISDCGIFQRNFSEMCT